MPVVGAGQEELRGVRRARREHDDRTGEPLLAPVDVRDHRGDGATRRVGLQLPHLRVAQQREVLVHQGWADGDHVGVGLRVHQAGEAVTGGAADAGAEGGVGLVEHDPVGGVERVQPHLCETVEELLDARLVRDRRVRVWPAGWVGRVLSAGAVHLVQVLGLGVVRLEDVVVDRPRGRDAAVVLQLAEVLLPETGTAQPRRTSSLHRRSSGPAAGRPSRPCRTRCPGRRSGCRRRPRWRPSSRPRGAASRRARGSAPACRTGRAGVPECLHQLRIPR